jgi:NADH-quinone oxidoreductase subunit E
MSHLNAAMKTRAEALIALYPEARSAIIPLCHLAQEQDGYLSEPAMVEIASMVGATAAEVRGTASFYDMLHLEPVGTYLVGICTNIACLLAGGLELLEHASDALGINTGATTEDGVFTLEETECLADCDIAPCVQVNHRYVRTTTPSALDELFAELRAGQRSDEIPSHGTLIRTQRSVGLMADATEVKAERQQARAAAEARASEKRA